MNYIMTLIIICGLLTIIGFSATETKAAPPRLERDPAVASPAPALKITAAAEQNEVTIGEWITITLTFTNNTADKMDIIKPMLDIDSVSFLVKPAGGKSFVYSVITPSVYGHNKEQMTKVSLAAGAQIQETFRVPAATLGLWEIMAHYQGSNKLLSSEPLKISIIPPKEDKPAYKDAKPREGELIAKIETSKGTMKCRFFFNDAPNTAMSFIRLSKDGFHNKLKFHRIVKNFVIQGGDPQNTGSGNPGFSIKAEFNKNKHLKGTLSMARGDPNDSAGSQYFICLGDAPNLDNKYTAFGELISGLDVLEAIGSIRTVANPNMGGEMSKPVENVFVKTISLEFKETPSKK